MKQHEKEALQELLSKIPEKDLNEAVGGLNEHSKKILGVAGLILVGAALGGTGSYFLLGKKTPGIQGQNQKTTTHDSLISDPVKISNPRKTGEMITRTPESEAEHMVREMTKKNIPWDKDKIEQLSTYLTFAHLDTEEKNKWAKGHGLEISF